MNVRLTVQYDGTNYVGWQRQDSGVSIQSLLEDALEPIEGARVTVHGAGRTDAGVHALAQVASTTLTTSLACATLVRALNAVLPADVRVLGLEQAESDFHARFSATGKTYEYRFVDVPVVSPFVHRYVWHVRQPLNLEAMQEAALPLVGTHDFAAFQGAGSAVASTVRTVRAIDWEAGRAHDRPIVMRIEGDGFLRHMVRNIVGTLVEVGVGRLAVPETRDILASRDRARAGPTAPPQGLFLVRVMYGPSAG